MPIRLVLFDFEETLVNIKVDDSSIVEFLKKELQRVSPPGIGLQQMNGIKELFDAVRGSLDKAAWEGVQKTFSSMIIESEKSSLASVKLRKSAGEAFSSTRDGGTNVGVVTRMTEQGARDTLKHLNLEGDYEVYGSPCHSTDQKQKVRSAIEKSDMKPDDAVFVVSSIAGVETAKALGVRNVAVYSQETPIRQMLASKPDALIYSIVELEQTLFYLAERERSSEPKPPIEP